MPKSNSRIYVITPRVPAETVEDVRRLVRAPNSTQALRHVASEITVTLASQDELVDLVAAGIQVETAGAEPAAQS